MRPAYDISRIPALFTGTGRVGIMALGVNATTFGSFGDGASSARFARRAGAPHYVLLKETAANDWLGSDIPSTAEGTAGVPYLAARARYRPMKRMRYDAAGVTDGSGGAVDFPQTSSTSWIEFDVGILSSAITRLGVIIGYTGDNCAVAKVEVWDGASNVVVPNLLPTAAQAATRGQISTAARDAIGASAYVLGTSALDAQRCGGMRMQHIPIADDLTAGTYRVRLTYTAQKGLQTNTSTAVDRMYVAYATYGTAAMAHTDSGAELYLMDWWGAAHDASANEEGTVGGRPTGSGLSSLILGGAHGGEKLSATPVLTVDGSTVELYARTTSRARTSNVATLVFDRAHRRTTGDVVTISGVSGTGYNAEGVSVTVVDATTLTYANSGTNEGTTADTGGRYIGHSVIIGSTASVAFPSNYYHANYGGGATVVATGTVTYAQGAASVTISNSITLSVGWDADTSMYMAMGSQWCGDRSSLGPEYGGAMLWKRAGTADAGVALNQNNGSEVLSGGAGGYCAFGTDTGRAMALLIRSTSPAIAQAVVQDRTGGVIDKAYLRAVTTMTAFPIGSVFSSTVERYDGALNPTGSYPPLR